MIENYLGLYISETGIYFQNLHLKFVIIIIIIEPC